MDNDMPLFRCLLTDAFCLYIPLFCTWILLYARFIVNENYMKEIKTILTEWFWFPFLLLQISYNCNIEFNV